MTEGDKYFKLVRDKIPEIIKRDGSIPTYRKADIDEYECELYEKLNEEVLELFNERNVEELADVMEVLNAIMDLIGTSTNEVEVVRSLKARERGTFKDRVILETVLRPQAQCPAPPTDNKNAGDSEVAEIDRAEPKGEVGKLPTKIICWAENKEVKICPHFKDDPSKCPHYEQCRCINTDCEGIKNNLCSAGGVTLNRGFADGN